MNPKSNKYFRVYMSLMYAFILVMCVHGLLPIQINHIMYIFIHILNMKFYILPVFRYSQFFYTMFASRFRFAILEIQTPTHNKHPLKFEIK